MGFTIPEPFAWDESFRVDYDVIDTEHKGLFTGIFDCAAAPADAGKLKSLVDLLNAHFSSEEGMMSKAKYPDFDGHKKMHENFMEKINSKSAPLDAATLTFAKEWLVNHIKETDFKYKGKL
uniref:Hemerythrin n=2 Tax=Bilateria TaxID=33213 RepID=A0A286RT47_9ECHI|nr:hemerythrin [Glycinde armigera]ASW22275.1 hemerythrin [Labidiaster sp. Labidia1]